VKVAFNFLRNVLKKHKLKLAVLVLSPILFIHLTFDYSNLSGLATETINRALSGGGGARSAANLRLVFSDISFHALPIVGIGMVDLVVDMPSQFARPLNIDRVIVGPEWRSLLSFRLGGFQTTASGLWNGNLELSMRPLKAKTNQDQKLGIDLQIEDLSLQQILKQFPLAVPLAGTIGGKVDGEWDSSWNPQPKGEISIEISNFRVSKTTIVNGILIPKMTLKNISLKTQMKEGKITISELKIGKEGDPIVGIISGEADIKWPLPAIRNPADLPIRYRLNVDLSLNEEMQAAFGSYLLAHPLSRFSQKKPGYTRYAAKLIAQKLGDLDPKIEAL
jgi:type II secretion system protein N